MSALHKYNISVYGGVNENSIHRPTHLNAWIQVSGLLQEEFGGEVMLEELSNGCTL